MNSALLAKLLVGGFVATGISSTSAYFGTKETVESFFKNNKNEKLFIPKNWTTHTQNLKQPSEPKKDPNTQEFKDLKSSDWVNLQQKCESIYKETYKVFWHNYLNIEKENDIRNYCFSKTEI